MSLAEKNLNILFLNQYYTPDLAASGKLLADLAESLTADGHSVRVICAQPSYTSRFAAASKREIKNEVEIHRISVGTYVGRERAYTRVIGYLRYLWGAFRKASQLGGEVKPDVVITFTNPPMLGLIGVWMARRRKCRFYMVVHDILPDAMQQTTRSRVLRAAFAIWNVAATGVMSRAELVIVPGDLMKSHLVEKKGLPESKVEVIPNWGVPENVESVALGPIREQLGIDQTDIVLLYAGNMGTMHRVDWILDAAQAVRDMPVKIIIMGGGLRRPEVIRRCSDENLNNIVLLPYQTEERFKQILGTSDACFVPLLPGFERFAVPSRAYTYLSAGKPLITLMAPKADIALLVGATKCGWNLTSGSALPGLIRNFVCTRELLVEAGLRGRSAYVESFTKAAAVKRYADVLSRHA